MSLRKGASEMNLSKKLKVQVPNRSGKFSLSKTSQNNSFEILLSDRCL